MEEFEGFFRDWWEYTMQRLARSLDKKNVRFSQGSADDFVKNSIQIMAPGVFAGHVTFRVSGAFVDMGVGKGRSLADARAAGKSTAESQHATRRRTAKKWYSPVFYGRIYWMQGVVSTKVIDSAMKNFPTLPTEISLSA